jgi:hypothetical protein
MNVKPDVQGVNENKYVTPASYSKLRRMILGEMHVVSSEILARAATD